MKHTTMFASFGLVSLMFVCIINITMLWLTVSGATSIIKAVTSNCGTRYSIEAVVAGNWFCPEVTR